MPAKTMKRKTAGAARSKPRVSRAQGTFPKTRKKQQKGAYVPTYNNPGIFGRVGRAAGGIIGGHFGGRPGAEIGQRIGGLAHYIGRLFGSGDYRIGAPPAVNSLFQNGGAAPYPFQRDLSFGEKAVVIKHREYLGDVITSDRVGAFNVQNYQVNPGLASTFPWLSEIAPAFQLYKWRGMVVEFKSKSADALNSVNTALGSVILATDYNAATFTQQFTNKTEMLNYEGAIDCKPSDNMAMGIECDPKRLPLSELYVRTGDIGGGNIQNYDMCSFAIATTGFQGQSVNIGELWICYDVILMTPAQLPPGGILPVAHYQLTSPIENSGTATNTLLGNCNGLAGNQIKVFDKLDLCFGYTTASPPTGGISYIGVKDRSRVVAGMILEFRWLTRGASTPSLGCPQLIDPFPGPIKGTAVSPYTNTGTQPIAFKDWGNEWGSIGSPADTPASQSQSSSVFYVVVLNPAVLFTQNNAPQPLTWSNQNNEDTSNWTVIAALGNSNLGGALSTVPAGPLTAATLSVSLYGFPFRS